MNVMQKVYKEQFGIATKSIISFDISTVPNKNFNRDTNNKLLVLMRLILARDTHHI